MPNPLIITLDGPLGSGKTSLGRALARRLRLPFLSTGLLYRAVAYMARKLSLPSEEAPILAVLADHPLSLVQVEGEYAVSLEEEVIPTEVLKDEEIAELASKVAQFPGIRQTLLPIQRQALSPRGLVAEGRDLGSVVFPQATLKLYLVADPKVRFQRRAKELGLDPHTLSASICRDERDQLREIAPLTIPEGAKVLDTTHRSVEELLEIVLNYLNTLNSAVPRG